MKLNEKIKSNRIRLGLTQEELANKINVTRQTISKYELGVNVPDIFTLKLLANIFNISIDELLDDNNLKLVNKRKILFFSKFIHNYIWNFFSYCNDNFYG